MKSEVCKSGFWGKKAWKCDSPPAPSTSTALATYSGLTGRWKYLFTCEKWWLLSFLLKVLASRGKLANYPIFKWTVRHRRSVIEPCFTFEHILPKSLTEIRISRNLYARKYLDKSGIGEVWLKIPRVEAKFEIWSVSHKKHRPANSHFYDWILHGYGNCHSLNCPLIVSFIILTFGQIAQFCSKTIKFHLVVWASDPVDGTGWWWRKALEINPFSEKATQKLDQSAFSMDLFFVAKMFPPLNIIYG